MPIKTAVDKDSLPKVFSSIAPYYDFLNGVLSFNNAKLWRKKSVDTVLIKEDAKILDLCTGTAEIAIEFAKRKSACQVFGIDFSWEMLKKAKDKISKLKLEKRIYLVEADVFNLPFQAEYFDIVSISFGLRNLVDYRKGVSEIVNMLKEGGQVIILEFSPPPNSVFGRVINFYLKNMIPLIAVMFGGSLDAYNYLSSSISTFLYPEQILDCMDSAGLKNLCLKKMSYGVINSYYGEK